MVDEKKMAITPAVEISYLKPDEQKLLIDTMDSEQTTPSLSQAQRLKKLSQEGKLNDDTMLDIMMEQKKPEKRDVVLTEDILRKYFPRNYTPLQVQQTVIRLLYAARKEKDENKQYQIHAGDGRLPSLYRIYQQKARMSPTNMPMDSRTCRGRRSRLQRSSLRECASRQGAFVPPL
jgi:hypothetical protein